MKFSLRPRSNAYHYGLALLWPFIALTTSFLAQPWGTHLPSMLFLVALAACAWFHGRGPTLVMTLLAVLLLNYYFFPPLYSFRVTSEEMVELGLFTAVGGIVSRFVGDRRRALIALEEHERTLQQTVAERTSELVHANEQLQLEIAERRQAEQHLRLANEELQHFAYVISHDLQEPLRAITIYSELLHRTSGSQLSEDGSRSLRFVVDGAKRMRRLITGLLTYLRETAADSYTSQDVALDEVLDTALANLQLQLEETQAVIERRSQLPFVSGQQQRLITLFQNLVSNALKYRRPGITPRISIYASTDSKQDLYTIAVQDNGPGISPEDQERVFGLFTRLQEAGQDAGGTGLGLAICRKLVERQGGRMWVESEPGQGATFLFTLPGSNMRIRETSVTAD